MINKNIQELWATVRAAFGLSDEASVAEATDEVQKKN